MKLRSYLFALVAFLSLPTISCGGSSDPDEPAMPSQKLTCRGASIADGATVDAYQVTEITVQYNNLISIAAEQKIKLNGKAISASVSGMELKAAVGLTPNTEYTLSIEAGAVALASDPKVTNEAFTLKFFTEKTIDPAETSASLINANATAETVALYKKLREGYGKVMYSGAMGGVGWETTYTDFIFAQTKRYPAVVGFDYLHLKWSPANWIDYGDITPVKRVHDRGCIVQIQWHWNVPSSENATDGNFSADKTSFNPANVLIEGTWEQKIAEADVDKLAGYLKLLQDARIPVLWRPFHEAAGDYKWGAWFWWGAKGPEVTKKLWYWLYDKLTNQYKLNNLIWVWTVCTSQEGKPAPLEKMQESYPGDKYVDIVGTDLYPQATLTDQSAQFNLVNSVVQGKKMVALTECGNLVSPEAAYKNHALWLYFMQWYDMNDGVAGFFNYKGPQQWIDVLKDQRVISLD